MGPAPLEGVALIMNWNFDWPVSSFGRPRSPAWKCGAWMRQRRGLHCNPGRVTGALLIFCAALAGLARPARAAGQQSLIIVQGASGEDEYGDAFTKSADNWVTAAKTSGNAFTLIGRDASPADEALDKDRLKKAIEQAAGDSADPLWIVLIGHGTYDGHDAKFNLRGTDVSDSELAAWLKPLTRPVAVIDCSSASSPFLARLSAPNRVIITATRSGSEVNYCRFGLYFSEAIADPAADLDKDGQVSLLEAFLAASNRTNEFYKHEGRLATEHAMLDDNGDRMGITADFFDGLRPARPAQNGAALDGPRARQWALVLSPAEQAMPEDLRAQRNALELQIESLHNQKSRMSEDAYYQALDPILIDLAKIYAQEPAPRPADGKPTGGASPDAVK